MSLWNDLEETVRVRGHIDYFFPDGRVLTIYHPDRWLGTIFTPGEGESKWKDDDLGMLLLHASEKIGMKITPRLFFDQPLQASSLSDDERVRLAVLDPKPLSVLGIDQLWTYESKARKKP